MLKFEHIPVGAYIRAYDFEPCRGREDKYIEGEVVALPTREGLVLVVVILALSRPRSSRAGINAVKLHIGAASTATTSSSVPAWATPE